MCFGVSCFKCDEVRSLDAMKVSSLDARKSLLRPQQRSFNQSDRDFLSSKTKITVSFLFHEPQNNFFCADSMDHTQRLIDKKNSLDDNSFILFIRKIDKIPYRITLIKH